MFKSKKKTIVSSDEEFALLVGQLERDGYHGIPKAMSAEGLKVLAFDLEARDKLARARAWIKSQGDTQSEVAKTSPSQVKKSVGRTESPAKTDSDELTTEQQEMAERIRRQQSKDAKPATPTASTTKKPKRRRRRTRGPKKNQSEDT